MWEILNGKFRRRDVQTVLKEKKLQVAGALLRAMDGLTLPQQRAVLNFTMEVVEHANKRFWRDGKPKEVSK